MAISASEQLDLAVWPMFYEMTRRGIKVDMGKLMWLQHEVSMSLALSTGQLPEEIEFTKPRTIAAWMESQGLQGKRTKSGPLCTDERSLAIHDDPDLNRVLECRGLAKLLNTFIEPTMDLVLENGDGAVHPRWKLTRVRSGRVACEKPNLMAFPARDPIGLKVRKCFIARPGHTLVSVDFSQIEPRTVAALSRDPKLLTIYRDGRDIYKETGLSLGISRDAAKIVTLGVLYGMEERRLQEQLKLAGMEYSIEQCEALIDNWFRTYPQVRELANDVCTEARSTGAARTDDGRLRFLPGLYLSGNRWPEGKLREEAERQAFNHLIQGTAQEHMKRAMVRVDGIDGAYPLLQLHDELVFEVDLEKGTAAFWASTLAYKMATVWQGMHLKTSSKAADSWGDLK